MITPDAPFDRFLKGDANAPTPTQKDGLALFMDKGCSACHNGINVGGGMYAPSASSRSLGLIFCQPDRNDAFVGFRSGAA